MKYFYILAIATTIVMMAYVAGRINGIQRCHADNTATALKIQTQIMKQKEIINAQVIHTGLGDIRRILREKYTIAD